MRHPDEMSPVEHFKILCEERPVEAEALLEQAALAAFWLERANSILSDFLDQYDAWSQDRPGGYESLSDPGSPAQVAVDFGALAERYKDAIRVIIEVTSLTAKAMVGECPVCESLHGDADPGE